MRHACVERLCDVWSIHRSDDGREEATTCLTLDPEASHRFQAPDYDPDSLLPHNADS